MYGTGWFGAFHRRCVLRAWVDMRHLPMCYGDNLHHCLSVTSVSISCQDFLSIFPTLLDFLGAPNKMSHWSFSNYIRFSDSWFIWRFYLTYNKSVTILSAGHPQHSCSHRRVAVAKLCAENAHGPTHGLECPLDNHAAGGKRPGYHFAVIVLYEKRISDC